MRGATGRVAWAALAAALLAVISGCGDQDESIPVPTFGGSETVAGVGPRGSPGDVGIPDDCDRLLPTADLVAVLGMPLNSVAVRTTIGVPEPSVGRVERVTCRYTATQGAAGDAPLLEVNSGRYVDEAAATRQWRVNTDIESGPRRPVPFGTARAVLIERPEEALISVANRDVAVTLKMPANGPRPPGRSTADTLIDLALRTLAVITPPQDAPSTL